MSAGGVQLSEKSASRVLEDLAASYRAECATGVPMSVHERYGRRLSSLRAELRSLSTPRRLGDVLQSMGIVDAQQLADALHAQAAGGNAKLLGEILIDLGWASEEMIRSALELQFAAGSRTEAGFVGATRDGQGERRARRQA
ncbi:MAG: hypothetical protein AB7V19_02880 [Candidatus Bipolaricaulia bacterium]